MFFAEDVVVISGQLAIFIIFAMTSSRDGGAPIPETSKTIRIHIHWQEVISHFHQLSPSYPAYHPATAAAGGVNRERTSSTAASKTSCVLNMWGISKQVRYVATLFPTKSRSTTCLVKNKWTPSWNMVQVFSFLAVSCQRPRFQRFNACFQHFQGLEMIGVSSQRSQLQPLQTADSERVSNNSVLMDHRRPREPEGVAPGENLGGRYVIWLVVGPPL